MRTRTTRRRRLAALGALLVGAVIVALATLAGPASATTITATPSSLQGWDFSQTRTTGHYAFHATGLHIWTDDASGQAKVAGYVPVSTSLSAVAAGPTPTIDWAGTSPAPGLQLVVVPSDGVPRILVGEAVYGDKWWMSDSYCATPAGWCDALDIAWSGGGGSAHSATLAEWSAKLDEANVSHFGFSLGSGVKGDGTIRSLTLGGDDYRFDVDEPPVTTTTTVPTTTSTTTTTSGTSSTATSSTTTGTATSSSTSGTGGAHTVSYVNCADARAHGAAPLRAGQLGYRVGLDDDRDGVACESDVARQVGYAGLPDTGTSGTVKLLWLGGLLVTVGGATLGLLLIRRRATARPDARR